MFIYGKAIFSYNMETGRLRRYKDKIDLIIQRTSEFKDWSWDFFKEAKSKLACYKAFQEIAESVFDIAAMAVKDAGQMPTDDYGNADRLVSLKIIDTNLKQALNEANGLRNRIVHEYNGLQDKRALGSIEAILPQVKVFVDKVQEWVKTK